MLSIVIWIIGSLPAFGFPSIHMGYFSNCAAFENGAAKCWGYNNRGQLGRGELVVDWGGLPFQMGKNLKPAMVGTDLQIRQIAMGQLHTCALSSNGRVKCWGRNQQGQLGLGHGTDLGRLPEGLGDNLPFVDLGTNNPVVQLIAGANHTCVLFDGGRMKCWGASDFGQLGIGTYYSVGNLPNEMGEKLPFVDLGTLERVVQLASGAHHTCALFETGAVKCWGGNFYGELGIENTIPMGDVPQRTGAAIPFVNLGDARKAIQLSVGSVHSCALLGDHGVVCWGAGMYGQLGTESNQSVGHAAETMGNHLKRIDFGDDTPVVKIVSGVAHNCALFKSNQVKCWGYNAQGILGLGHGKNMGADSGTMGGKLPYVSLGLDAIDIAAGGFSTCALLTNREWKCWGRNDQGLLGLGDKVNRGAKPEDMGDNLPFVDLETRQD